MGKCILRQNFHCIPGDIKTNASNNNILKSSQHFTVLLYLLLACHGFLLGKLRVFCFLLIKFRCSDVLLSGNITHCILHVQFWVWTHSSKIHDDSISTSKCIRNTLMSYTNKLHPNPLSVSIKCNPKQVNPKPFLFQNFFLNPSVATHFMYKSIYISIIILE